MRSLAGPFWPVILDKRDSGLMFCVNSEMTKTIPLQDPSQISYNTSMTLQFTKMHGLGNDFMVIDGVRQTFALSAQDIAQLADRHLGVGFDQLLLVEAATDAAADFTYRIFNADGGEVAQCGNGARCIARFIAEQGLTDKKKLRLQTLNGIVETELLRIDNVKVSLGVPDIISSCTELMVQQQSYTIGAVSVGNPHAILWLDNIDATDVATVGAVIEKDPFFPEGANVSFVQAVDRCHLLQRVWERGAGLTAACGSAACAAAVMGISWGFLDAGVEITFPGGLLQVEWQGPGTPVWLTGPAETVFTAQLA